ncbi:MAG: hypothetical protein AAFX78_03495 [Cyanobacteria bacterium J06638_20]
MAAVSAVNPNQAAPSTANRRADMVDSLLLLRDINDGAETTDAAEAAVNIDLESLSMAAIVINSSGSSGTVDGSNYWDLIIEAADNTGFSNPTTLLTQTLPGTAAEYYLPIDGRQLETFRTAGEDPSIYIRCRLSETGTTATDVTYGAYITSQC